MPVLRNFLKTIVPPSAERERPREGEWVQHPGYFAGKEALSRGDAAAAREAFSRVVAERPGQLDARAGLARANFVLQDPGTPAAVEEVLQAAIGGGVELLQVTLEELGPAAEAPQLRPPIAWRVAQRMDAAGDAQRARAYYQVAARADGLVGLKARVRGLELDPEPGAQALSSAADLTAREPELHRRVAVLLKKFLPEAPRTIELPPDDTRLEFELRSSLQDDAPPPARPPPRIVPIRVEGLARGGLQVATDAGTRPLAFGKILGLAVGVVPGGDGRSVVLTDLVVDRGQGDQGPTVLRASLADLGLDRLYPGIPLKEAYWHLVGNIERASGAKRLPAGVDATALPRYASPEEMTRACHGAA